MPSRASQTLPRTRSRFPPTPEALKSVKARGAPRRSQPLPKLPATAPPPNSAHPAQSANQKSARRNSLWEVQVSVVSSLAPPQAPPPPLSTRQSEARPPEVAVGGLGGRCNRPVAESEAGGRGGRLPWAGRPGWGCRSGVRERPGSEVTERRWICTRRVPGLGGHRGGRPA